MSSLDWAVVGGYLAVLIAIGVWQKRKAEGSAEDYFVSGRKLPWWIAGTSMIAASFASDTPLLVAGYVHAQGIWGNWEWWGLGISTLLSAFLFARLWRRSGVLTEVELTEMRYAGSGAAVLRGVKAVYWGVVYNCFAVGALGMLGLSKVFQSATDWKPEHATLVCGLIAGAYTVMSGFWGVVATDLFQFVLAIFGSLACAYFAVGAAGGWDSMLSKVPAEKLALVPASATDGFVMFLSVILVQWWAWKNTDGGGLMVQRMAACRDERHAVWATLWYNIVHIALRGWPWVIVALASTVVLPELKDPNRAYSDMMMSVLPSGLKGLLFGWFLAEFMSVVNTNSNWGASLLVNDLYRRFVNPGALERHYVLVGRISTGLILIGAVVCGYLASDIRTSFRMILGGTAAVGVLLMLRWLWWRMNAWMELTAMILSPLGTFWIYPQWIKPDVLPVLGLEPNALVSLVSYIVVGVVPALIVGLLTPSVPDEALDAFYRRVRPPRWGWGRIARRCPEVEPDAGMRSAIPLWVCGLVTVYGLMYSVYALLFGRPYGIASAAVSLLALGPVVTWTRRTAGTES